MNAATQDRNTRIVAAAVLLLVIGPQWLVTRDLFDGATVALAAALRNPDGLYFWLSNGNWLLAVLFFKLVFGVSDLLGVAYLPVVKLAITGMLLGLYIEFVSLGRRLFAFAPDEARLVGLLCLASPSIYVFVNSAAVPILVCIWLMFLGHRLFWSERVAVRIAGLAVLAASFQLNSNLVLALALDVAFIARFAGRWRERVKWFAALLLVAIAVYGTMRVLAPPRQLFVEYNQLLNPLRADDLKRMLRALLMFATWGVLPLCAMAVAAAAALARRGPGPGGAARIDWLAIGTAAFLCAAAAFPYIMVGKGPALFTYVGFGNGLTEQVLRAVYSGPLAPTWSSTSARHGLLYAVPIALLSWLLARALAAGLRSGKARLPATALFVLVLPLFLAWVLPGYRNKLDMQFAEISLLHGLKKLPPAPAGTVDLRYRPPSDWLVWPNAANAILREAWGGRAGYYAMFHSVDVYRDDMQWQYHVYFKEPGGMKSPVIQRSVGMDKFPGEDCQTRYEATLPQPGRFDVWLAGLDPSRVPPAEVRLVASRCEPGQQLPNPTPEKKAIL